MANNNQIPANDAAQLVELNIAGLNERMSKRLTMNVHGANDTIISEKLRNEQCWEPYETHLVVTHFHPGGVFLDIGANIGYYTLLASAIAGQEGQVIAYEPDVENFALLQENVSLNQLDNVVLHPLALSDRNEDGKLFLSSDNFGDHRIYSDGGERHSRSIRLVHGDQHLEPQTQHIDFLKIDTQGAEYFVVNGLRNLIAANSAHLCIILEFCPYGIRYSGADGHQLIELLESFGMQYHIIDHIEHRLIPAQAKHLSDWVEELAQEPSNEGFINLLVTPRGYAAV
ncbi:FkbM family methyltransferase [Zhongshania sp.]|uniref:FkbM family methyltransferase n=1 Tax=Zhongshania sp. TaxID=1971902 RepID=UPI001B4931B6|nr:FkbM family methyltransferase [Zhongshania sp.]MBQ0797019.1 FkbM family methyltransferase [Zhongshania sp.]